MSIRVGIRHFGRPIRVIGPWKGAELTRIEHSSTDVKYVVSVRYQAQDKVHYAVAMRYQAQCVLP